MRYFAFACDYDGTLAQHGRVNDDTVAALEQVVASGRRLIMVTGRDLDDLLTVFPRVDLFEWVVAENGALLYQPSSKKERPLAEPIRPEFAEELSRRGVQPVNTGRVIIATWEPHENTVLDTIRDMGLELQVVFNKGAVMVLPAGINKASGLKAALKEMDLSPHNVAGIGDAENDHAFLRMVEFSAAVENALPLVKEGADCVTKLDHGGGVQEIARALIADDLRRLCEPLRRHDLSVGRTEDGGGMLLSPSGASILLAGTSGSGKSTLAKVFLERLADADYQFCIVDPEGDYEDFEEGVVLGTEKNAPTVDEVMQLLAPAEQNAVVNLLGVHLDDRPAFFTKLLSGLIEMRARTGRPHWILVDEAHHLMPVGWEPGSLALPQELLGLILITVHPDIVSRELLRLIDTIATVGETPGEMVRSFAMATGARPPKVPEGSLPTGEALIWSRSSGKAVRRFQIGQTRLQHLRHRRKYAEGDLGDRSFFFVGPRRRTNLKAQNLILFMQIGEGVDDDTWTYHLERGDYATWFRSGIKNDELADEADEIARAGLSATESRRRIRDAIEKHYTMPAPFKPALSAPEPAQRPNQVSRRSRTAEKDRQTPRRTNLDRTMVAVDPVQLLKKDHQEVKGMFQRFEGLQDKPEEMKALAEKCIMELQIHSMIEEELFYPAMRRGQETEELLNEAEEEHHVVDLLIDEILRMKPTDKNYHAKFTVLAENVKHHIGEEEGEMLPKAQQLIGSRYADLGKQMADRKQKLMAEFKGKPRKMTSRSSSTRASSTRAKSTTSSRAKATSSTRGSTKAKSR